MRIGIDARLTYYREGGIANYMRQIIAALAEIDSEGDYCILRSRKDHRDLTSSSNFSHASMWTPCHHRLERWALGTELLPLRLALLHSPDFIPPLWGARRNIITVHDLNFLHYPQFLTEESRRFYNDQIHRAVEQADHILADSEATRTDLVEMLGVSRQKITVHMLGVDTAFRPLAAEDIASARKKLDLPHDFILFVGTFEPRKNIGGLIDAYQRLLVELPDAPPLVLAGRRGWLADDLFARVEALDLNSHILWREDVPQNLLPALYNAASILAAPSYYEGFGLTALEAMACGTPTIVANRSSLPEVTGDTGLLVNPDDIDDIADGLLRLLTDSDLASQSRSAGLRRAAKFTWHETATTVHRVYQQFSA